MASALDHTHQVSELELLRIKVAHLAWQNAQLQAQRLAQARDAVIRTTLLAYVAEADLDQYVIDLDAGTVRPRDEGPGWDPTP